MFRRECLFDIGLYNEKYTMREGHDLHTEFERNLNRSSRTSVIQI